MNKNKMTSQEKIEAVEKWQKCDCVHTLTCGENKCDGILKAKVNTDIDPYFEWNEPVVFLTCPKCNNYTQEIPEIVFYINCDSLGKRT